MNSVNDSPALRFVTRRDNYESKINSVSHSVLGHRALGVERPSHVDPNTRVLRARSRLRARVYDIRRIRNELFAKFMQICMDRMRWLGERGQERAYSYVINIHELQSRCSVLLLPSVFSHGFLPFRRSFSRRRNFIASTSSLACLK